MPIDFRNTNTVWASILVETLQRLGLTTAVISPGSRSTPITVAFAQHEHIETIPILDERSAAFFALGIARKSGLPVALVCTSGTAAANFYPAVIEARESRVSLLILTADRPPELRECHSGQAIDQQKLYGNYPNWYAELAVPLLDMGMLRYLRQTVIHAWERSRYPVAGVVHLNCPFRDPLAPIPQFDTDTIQQQLQSEDFFIAVTPTDPSAEATGYISTVDFSTWQRCDRGIIIAGVAQPQQPREYCRAIAQLSQQLGWAVLAEGLSPVRNYADFNPYLISTYDLILRNRQLAHSLKPEMVIQIGELPTSKELRAWLETCQPQRWVLEASHHNLDPLHGKTKHLRVNLSAIVEVKSSSTPFNTMGSPYLQHWCKAEASVRLALDQTIAEMTQLFEGKAAWLLSQCLPAETPLFIANSMPVRDIEFFWKPGNKAIQPWFNRGANGIDGTLSTALGIAHRNRSSILLTGDLALLHDTNGFLLNNRFVGHLTIILINNNGGGIFEMLPIAKFDPLFEEFFATPQKVNFTQLCATYGVDYQLINSWQHLKQCLNPLPTEGIRVLELQTNRKADARWYRENLEQFAACVED